MSLSNYSVLSVSAVGANDIPGPSGHPQDHPTPWKSYPGSLGGCSAQGTVPNPAQSRGQAGRLPGSPTQLKRALHVNYPPLLCPRTMPSPEPGWISLAAGRSDQMPQPGGFKDSPHPSLQRSSLHYTNSEILSTGTSLPACASPQGGVKDKLLGFRDSSSSS